MNYFRLAEVKGVFEELDGWMRRKLRCLLWRQWKRNFTRAKATDERGLEEVKAWKSATNGRGPWWNAGASHMNEAFPKSFFDRMGLISLSNRSSYADSRALHEPPDTEPYVRWCGRTAGLTPPPTR